MNQVEIAEKLSAKGMRVTPQRIAILGAILKLNNHPTAENIIEYIKINHPNISIGTVYKVLDSFVENHLLKKVKTEGGIMRYDPLPFNHHHLYCEETDRIEDYEDQTLDELIIDYFEKKGIKNFTIQNIQLHITGKFKH
ncbi:Fur family transcriptional regulator [Flavilitoribacter nigricans]|uniref:Transcriptional repressor n=1 Tax=Flavilitoribacter nigricans (strain ATCC 23147 / DSM 23189 / NBRC 102662 / NCIMB 1420 / SS-2) TaxID=1122177 RepID=A0A2D0NEB5_FLAN2|nr:transcriptional repressor [Flavilitoribacter nigricans]PHN06817.1 transcriptional repressor [Flavilitoribacter nigricans DSM 23189 = NBRC 102662]